MAPLFKVLSALARNYKVNLIKNQLVESIFAPLLQLDHPKYNNLPLNDITMYLECLATLSTLSDAKIFETKPDIFQKEKVHFLVAMSIKHGSAGNIAFFRILHRPFYSNLINSSQSIIFISFTYADLGQCSLALSLATRFSYEKIGEMIASKDSNFESNDSQYFTQKIQSSAVGKDLSAEASSERVKNVFFNIEKAVLANKVYKKL